MDRIFWSFFFYSFCGFLLEVAFARLSRQPNRSRKCHLLLPVCPVYGLGALGILLLPEPVRASPPLLFLCGAAAATAAEWGMSLFYEKAAGTAFWDYSALPWNLGGRVCPLFSFFWGLLALALAYGVHPLIAPWLERIPPSAALPAALLYAGDAAVSLSLLRRGGVGALRWRRYQRS